MLIKFNKCLSAMFIFYFSTVSSQDLVVFRIGTLNQFYEESMPSIKTFALFYGSETITLDSVTTPDNLDLFQGNLQPTNARFLGLSPLTPQIGNYISTYTLNGVSYKATASVNKDITLAAAENISTNHLGGKLTVSWQGVKEAESYNVILSHVGEDKDIARASGLLKTQDSVAFEIPLSPRNYLVVVRAYNFKFGGFQLPDTLTIS